MSPAAGIRAAFSRAIESLRPALLSLHRIRALSISFPVVLLAATASAGTPQRRQEEEAGTGKEVQSPARGKKRPRKSARPPDGVIPPIGGGVSGTRSPVSRLSPGE